MNYDFIKMAIDYVVSNPFFWGSMGFTSATAMFTGVLIYDGHLDQVKKGLISVLSYACLLFMTNALRVAETISNPSFLYSTTEPHRVYASLVSLVATTIAWVFGLLLGVSVFRHKYSKDVDSI